MACPACPVNLSFKNVILNALYYSATLAAGPAATAGS